MFKIRYSKLKFILKIERDCSLPSFKNSALRGGMGKMLMEFSCFGNGNCNECNYKDDCMVDKVMYSKLKYKPQFIANDKSVGYIIDCVDKRIEFKKGDELKFNLILFGDTIDFASNFIYAFDVLGRKGLGKYNNKYSIKNVLNENGINVLTDGRILKNNIIIKYVSEYIQERKKQLQNLPTLMINFISPFRYKVDGHYTSNISINDIKLALNRRMSILNGYEGIENKDNIESGNTIITSSQLRWSENKRYSSRQKESMKLGGVEGNIFLNIENEEFLDLLIAGELVHIGKNTSFGLGKYILV